MNAAQNAGAEIQVRSYKKEFRVKLPSEQRSDRTKSVRVTSYEIPQRNDDAIEFGAGLERVRGATGS